MSPIAPEVSATSDRAPTFNRPIAPAPDIDRDGEMLNYYFDSTWTTKDIADHFKLTVPQVAAWFQRSDIAALIDFVTAANDRRARDIARENLPGTIDILLRISRLRNDDKTSRAASSALISFSRGRATAALAKRAAKQAQAQVAVQSTASDRSRGADPSTTCSASDGSTAHDLHGSPDQSHADPDRAHVTSGHAPGRLENVPRSAACPAVQPSAEPSHAISPTSRPAPSSVPSLLSPPHRCAG